MSLRGLGAVVALVATCAVSCGGKIERADVNQLVEVSAPTVVGASSADDPAALDETLESARQVEVLEPARREAAAAEVAVNDIAQAFVADLAAGRIAEAATLTTGDATEFLRRMAEGSACGFRVEGATLVETAPAPELIGLNRYALGTPIVLEVGAARPQVLDQLILERQRDSRWLIADLFVGGVSAVDAMASALQSDRRNELRLTQTKVCLGPQRIDVNYDVANTDDQPLLPTDVYFRTRDGARVEIDGGVEALGLERLPAKSETVWTLGADVPNGFDGAELVLVAVDVDRSQSEGGTIHRERVYDIAPSSLFSDVEPGFVRAIDEVPASGPSPTS